MASLYNKYRPSKFSDFVGQREAITVLQRSVVVGKTPAALIFKGHHGCGKTSLSRVLAAAVNEHDAEGNPIVTGEVYKSIAEGRCQDVIEYAAAENTSVDGARELVKQAYYKPSVLKTKVFILDEVHRLSGQAFDALLKIFEEPPENVIFILCTTNPEKIPLPIRSRCEMHEFRAFTPNEILGRLRFVCQTEGIEAEEAALRLVAENSTGSMRNALVSLEMLSNIGTQLTLSLVEDRLGIVPIDKYIRLIGLVGHGFVANVINITSQICVEGKTDELRQQLLRGIRMFAKYKVGLCDEPDNVKASLEEHDIAMSKITAIGDAILDYKESSADGLAMILISLAEKFAENAVFEDEQNILLQLSSLRKDKEEIKTNGVSGVKGNPWDVIVPNGKTVSLAPVLSELGLLNISCKASVIEKEEESTAEIEEKQDIVTGCVPGVEIRDDVESMEVTDIAVNQEQNPICNEAVFEERISDACIADAVVSEENTEFDLFSSLGISMVATVEHGPIEEKRCVSIDKVKILKDLALSEEIFCEALNLSEIYQQGDNVIIETTLKPVERILSAYLKVFGNQGLDVSMINVNPAS